MDIVVGRVTPTGSASDQRKTPEGYVEAKVLHVRQPRGRRAAVSGKPARKPDPPGARVLVLLVPDAHKLPDDLADGPYRLFVRIARR